ncbi:MAG: flagellar basal body rod protein FlgB [Nitrospinae bacterium]|nr:flagellar basal body rod protein FlgB [Nitrospinota bacterium]
MDILKLAGGSIDIFKKILDFRLERQNLISSNIANMNTPNYKSVDISFDEQMKTAMDNSSGNVLKNTHKGHLPAGIKEIEKMKSEVIVDTTPSGLDGNNVDLDKEVTKIAENTIMYNTVALLILKKFEGLKYAIDQGGSK